MWVYTMPKILFAAKLIFGMHVVIDIADSRNSKHYATKWVPTLLLTHHSYTVIIHDGLVYSWNAWMCVTISQSGCIMSCKAGEKMEPSKSCTWQCRKGYCSVLEWVSSGLAASSAQVVPQMQTLCARLQWGSLCEQPPYLPKIKGRRQSRHQYSVVLVFTGVEVPYFQVVSMHLQFLITTVLSLVSVLQVITHWSWILMNCAVSLQSINRSYGYQVG